MRTAPVPDALEHVRVRAGSLEQPVLAREAKRLVVEGVAKEPRVVDLEHVDLGQVAMDRRRVGDRVEAVERVGEVDEAAPARGSRRSSSANVMPRGISSSRNSPITSPWSSVLISSPGTTTRSRVRASLDGLERAAEDVVVGHGDAAEPDRLGVVEDVLASGSSSRATTRCGGGGRW